MKRASGLLVSILLFVPIGGLAADAGADSYKLCAGCHGFKGEGNALVNAPRLAGQQAWYLKRQLQNFANGIRGGDGDDQHGRTMAQMMGALTSESDIDAVVAYIGTLPAKPAGITVSGNAEKGAALYVPCAACHGAKAEGNKTLNSPALAGLDDWYQLAQLKKFRSGERGAAPEDTYGQQMAPMVATLPDEAAMQDVIAYIRTLQP